MPVTAAQLAKLPEAERRALLAGLSASELEQLQWYWPFWALADQLPPEGDWRTFLLLGGRGSGKTRTASEAVRAGVESGERRQIGVIGPTADAVRRIQVEGPSGLLVCSPPWARANFEPSTRRVVWPSGAIAHLFSAEEPDRLRGPNLDMLWIDEMCSMPNAAVLWDMAMMALRIPGPLGHPPVAIITTTPKPSKLLRAIMEAPTTVTTRSKTSDNAGNLDASTLAYYVDKYGGTRLGRQELDAELLQDTEGALWQQSLIDGSRVDAAPASLKRIVIGVDPSGGGSASTGIVAVGSAANGQLYVVGDHSVKGSPETWGRAVCRAYHSHKANKVCVEKNFGGDMCISVLKSIEPNLPITTVTASRGKQLRAEPIVSLYEQSRVHHCGTFPLLEDEMVGWDPNGNPSPDRVDALVWACTELSGRPPMRISPDALRVMVSGPPRAWRF
jgi:phage terminase large subunit-like protein